MPLIHRLSEIDLKENKSPIPHFSWKSSLPLEEISKSKSLHFDIKSLFPGKFSYPYHFHRNAEELFIILEGEHYNYCRGRNNYTDNILRIHLYSSNCIVAQIHLIFLI